MYTTACNRLMSELLARMIGIAARWWKIEKINKPIKKSHLKGIFNVLIVDEFAVAYKNR